TVRRCGDSSLPVTAMLAVAGGNATAGADYVLPSSQIQFAALEVDKTVPLELLDDTSMEADETIQLALSVSDPATKLGPQATTVVTILDDDLAPSNVDERFRLRWIFQALPSDGKLLVTSSNSLWRLIPQEPVTVDGTFQPIVTRPVEHAGFIVRVLPQ